MLGQEGCGTEVKFDNNGALMDFSKKLEAACTNVVEDGFMTKDLAILVGMNQSWMETREFIKKISEKLNELMKNN